MNSPKKTTSLSQKIIALRDARGITTNKALALAAGIDVGTLSKLLNNKRGQRIDTLDKLAIFFGTSVDALRGSPSPVPASAAKAVAKVRTLESQLRAELANGSSQERLLELEIELGQAAAALQQHLRSAKRS